MTTINAILAGIAIGATYGLIALGIVLVYKATRVLNFAQAEIGTISIYLLWFMTTLGLPVLVALIIALVFAALMGVGQELMLRPLAGAPPLTITVATLGLATFLGSAEITMFGTDPRDVPPIISGAAFRLADIEFIWAQVLSLVLTAALGVGLYLFFKRTIFGLGVLAVAQEQTALRLMGLPLTRVSMFTWASGAVLTTLAGAIIVPTEQLLPFTMTLQLIPALAAALVGGLTSLPGAFLGGIVIGITQNIAKFYWGPSVPGAEYLAVFALIVLVLLVKPNGLLGAEA